MNYISSNFKGMISGHSNTTSHDITKIVEPLSTIIRLAIFNYKPIGTKLSIQNYKISYHEPAYLSGVYRCINGDNKEDIHYLHIPIDIACQQLLTKDNIYKYPNICQLFGIAKEGLVKLKNTYAEYPVIGQCIDRYLFIIDYNMTKSGLQSEISTQLKVLDPYVSKPLNGDDSIKYIKMMEVWKDEDILNSINLLKLIIDADNNERSCFIKALETCLLPIDERVQTKTGNKSIIINDV